jgi:RNA polymerase sigma-70 factor (ECF subfamily)
MFPDQLSLQKDDSAVPQRAILDRTDQGVGVTFEELFERYNSMVFNLAYQILGDREEALDVAQEVFLAIYQKMDTFRGESSLKTWIYRIAVRRAANRFRWWNRLRRRGTVSLEEHLSKSPESELSWNLTSRAKSPEDALLLQEEREKVKRMLMELPVHQRIAVIMRDIEGLSYEEIAESLNVSLGTIKSRIARGREILKQHFVGQ